MLTGIARSALRTIRACASSARKAQRHVLMVQLMNALSTTSFRMVSVSDALQDALDARVPVNALVVMQT